MNRSVARRLLIVLLLAAGVGYAVTGPILYKTAIDLDPSAFPLGSALQRLWEHARAASPLRPIPGPFWALFSLAAVGAAAFWKVHEGLRRGGAPPDPSRRRVLAQGLLAAGAALAASVVAGGTGLARALLGIGNHGRGWGPTLTQVFAGDAVKTAPEYRKEWRGAHIRDHRLLGRTGWRISDIVVGGGRIQGEQGTELVIRALDRGVNYVDTSPDYAATGSEQAVGRAIRRRRTQVFLATKFCTPHGHLPPGTPVSRYKRVVEDSLRRLGTDYVDLVHIHSCDEIERLMDPDVHEAFDRLKTEGKVRFLGFSSHTPNLIQVAERAIQSGRFDVMMLAYHFGIWPRLGEILSRARREADMGIVAMKTLKGAKHHGLAGFRQHADSYAQAALRWVLSNPDVSAAIISFFRPQHVDEYLSASGGRTSPQDLALLQEYDRQIRGSYCAPHCGACLSSCPEGVPIADVLRQRMYFEDYGDEKGAVHSYARLERNAAACLGCPAPCAGACPLGVPIQERTVGAHELLTFS